MNSIKEKLKNTNKLIRILVLLIYDTVAIIMSMYLSLLLRFDFDYNKITAIYVRNLERYIVINVILTLVIFFLFKMYTSLWRYASVQELLNTLGACLIAAGVQLIVMHMLEWAMPRSYYVMFFFFLLAFSAFSRFLYRGIRTVKKNLTGTRSMNVVPTMMIGAGDTAYALIKELNESYIIPNHVVCVIDENSNKIGSKILGVPIVGNDTTIKTMAKRYGIKEIFIAIPSISGHKKKELLEICKSTGCKMRMLPSMTQIVNGEVTVSALREVEIEDLLGRDQVVTNLEEVVEYISGKTILVTGGGGSIGSELCRQIAEHKPKQLIILDIYENTTYSLQLELQKKYPDLNLEVLIGSVRNTHRIETIFQNYHPEIIFHAAAHKHVPLMEDSPNEAIKNNVFGTLNVARIAGEYGAKRMVLISTDKAVNPTNIMGASKRLCELVIQSMNHKFPETNYVAVRFGNVLGSNGSVIPLFKKQIEEGGPVTVTDKNIIRYFMTIPEAVALVLQAGAYAKGGEIFVLDMGEPVRIDDMARNLIQLSGYEPDVDIPIVYTGLRPGEKLFEECLREEEGLEKTANNLIFIGKEIPFDEEEFLSNLEDLKKQTYEDRPEIKKTIEKLVPSYHSDETRS